MTSISRGIAALAASLCAAGCSASISPSEDSRFLEEAVVPQLLRWARGAEPSLSFSDVFRRRKYEFICLVPEYQKIDSIQRHVPGAIERYHSSFGEYVPETNVAVVFVKDQKAHAAPVYYGALTLGRSSVNPCVAAEKAKLTRINDPDRYTPLALLEEK